MRKLGEKVNYAKTISIGGPVEQYDRVVEAEFYGLGSMSAARKREVADFLRRTAKEIVSKKNRYGDHYTSCFSLKRL